MSDISTSTTDEMFEDWESVWANPDGQPDQLARPDQPDGEDAAEPDDQVEPDSAGEPETPEAPSKAEPAKPAAKTTKAKTRAKAPGPAKSTRTTKTAKLSKQVAEKATATVLAVVSADERELALMAELFGSEATVADVSIAVLTSTPEKVAASQMLKDLAALSPLEAGVRVAIAGRPVMREMWALLTSLGHAEGALSRSDTKASVAVVEAIGLVPESDWELMSRLSELGS